MFLKGTLPTNAYRFRYFYPKVGPEAENVTAYTYLYEPDTGMHFLMLSFTLKVSAHLTHANTFQKTA